MELFKIGGVPEHFNMPWHILASDEALKPYGMKIQWTDYPGGTGDLVKSLNSGELDLATLLTEGAIKGIDAGGEYKILNFFVDSPLIWGIHVPASSDLHGVDQLRGKKYAISRYGSGSHLISYLDTRNRNWPTEELEFVEVGSMEGAREAFKGAQADVFLWEKFTTKPLVDRGEFRLLGECIPQFSSFVICVSNRVWESRRDQVKQLLTSVLQSSAALLNNEQCVKLISQHYKMSEQDIEAWLERTRWTTKPDLERSKLNAAIEILKELSLVSESISHEDLVVT
ncbi:MAG: ABC transporter substrate-binding protein [Cyclobacteriaceae bacterium]